MGNLASSVSSSAVRYAVDFGAVDSWVGGDTKKTIARSFAPADNVAVNPVPLQHRLGYQSKRMKLVTKDGLRLDALLVPTTTKTLAPRAKRGAICFHGNGMTLDDMYDFVSFYYSNGCEVLLITMRGYPGSEGSVHEQGEQGIYLDVAAAVDYMLEQRGFTPAQLIAHGFSLGGSLAASAALHHKLGALVLDHTFTSAAAVATAIVLKSKQQIEATGHQASKYTKWVPMWFVRGAAGGAVCAVFTPGIKVDLGRAGTVITDGLSSVEKLSKYRGRLVICYGTKDHIMPVSFADDFVKAFPGTCTRIEILDGPHIPNQFQNPEAVKSIKKGLGLL